MSGASGCEPNTTSGLSSGRHSYVLLCAPYFVNLKLTFGCCLDALVTKEARSRFMDGFSQQVPHHFTTFFTKPS